LGLLAGESGVTNWYLMHVTVLCLLLTGELSVAALRLLAGEWSIAILRLALTPELSFSSSGLATCPTFLT
jgi:hypothetical protein